MTDTTEQKALALVNEVVGSVSWTMTNMSHPYNRILFQALCRAIEQHEAFRQEVSDALVNYFGEHLVAEDGGDALASFIIAKPDPLIEVLDEALWEVCNVKLTDRELRDVSLRLNAKRGGKIEGEG